MTQPLEKLDQLLRDNSWDEIRSIAKIDPGIARWADEFGETLVCRVARFRSAAALLEELLALGADPNQASHAGLSPLGAAIDGSHSHDNSAIENARLLIRAGADVNAVAENEFPAIHWAVQQGRREFVRLLLSNGADPRRQGPYQQNAIDIAREQGDQEIVACLEQFEQHSAGGRSDGIGT
jgi:uncharacterized protein